jgi:hypothetical protein
MRLTRGRVHVKANRVESLPQERVRRSSLWPAPMFDSLSIPHQMRSKVKGGGTRKSSGVTTEFLRIPLQALPLVDAPAAQGVDFTEIRSISRRRLLCRPPFLA